MKYTISLLFLFAVALFSSGQELHKEIKLENSDPYLIGPISTTELESTNYQQWYRSNYTNYKPNTKHISKIKPLLRDYKILVFMGTWCGDSKREVPRFIKILDESDFPRQQLKIVTVDRRKEHYKKSPAGEEWGLDIRRVPTFIFLKDGKEVNRIVERPVETLEKDLLSILKAESYVPNYAKASKTP